MIKQHIIAPVEQLVQKAIDNKVFVATDVSFPGFKLTKDESIAWFTSLIQTRVNIHYDLDMYDAKSFLGTEKEHDFEELVQADKDLKAGKRKFESNKLYVVLERLLPVAMKDDVNLSTKNIGALFKESFNFGLSHHVKATIMDIESLSFGPVNENYPRERESLVNNLAATMIFLRENNPKVFSQIKKEIEGNPLKDSTDKILQEIKTPTGGTILALHNFDKKFTQQNFPKEYMEFDAIEKGANNLLRPR